MLSKESGLQLFEGETKNFSEDFQRNELVLMDKSDPRFDTVHTVPETMLAGHAEIQDARLPLEITIKKYWPNATPVRPGTEPPPGAMPSGATAGLLKDVPLTAQSPVSGNEQRNTPAALVELSDSKGRTGSFLLSPYASRGESFSLGGKEYEVLLRPKRYYYPFSVTLLKATHEQYRGTDIPKNFASRVRVQNPDHNEARETVIYMNNPLRYSGLTFFQYQMSAGELAERAGMTPSSTFQVVHNPGWLTPYVSCLMVAGGLIVQFGLHLFEFIRKKIA